MPTNNQNHSAILARIEVTLEQLKETVSRLDLDAKLHRTHVYEALEAIRLNASHVDRSVTDMQGRMGKADITLGELEKWKQRSIGAWVAIVALISTISAGLTLAGKAIATWAWGNN